MNLSDEQKARAKAIADSVGNEPGKFFSDALKNTVKKGNDEISKLLANAKLKLGDQHAQISQLAEQTNIDIGVIREAYRVWYEKDGKNLVEQKKSQLKTSFDQKADEFEALCAVLKKDGAEIAEMLKKKPADSGTNGPDDPKGGN